MNTARMEGKLRDTVACNYDNFSGKTFACRLFSTWPSFASSKKELPDIMNYVHFSIRLENFNQTISNLFIFYPRLFVAIFYYRFYFNNLELLEI